MADFKRTSPHTNAEHERLRIAIVRLIVAGILILVLTRLGSAVSSLSADFAGVVNSIG